MSSRKFTEIARGLMYICKKRGAAESSIFYLDDALTVTGSKESCKKSLEIMEETACVASKCRKKNQ